MLRRLVLKLVAEVLGVLMVDASWLRRVDMRLMTELQVLEGHD